MRLPKKEFSEWWQRKNKVSIFFDGASKGNSGKDGGVGLIYFPGGRLETSFSWGLGQITNNQAEIFALLKPCQLAKEARHKDFQIFGDSEILIKVLNTHKQFSIFSLTGTMQRIQFILIEFDYVSFFIFFEN